MPRKGFSQLPSQEAIAMHNLGPDKPQVKTQDIRTWRQAIGSWWMQILAWLAGLSFYIAIIAILFAFNTSQQPWFPWNLSLSALVAFLANLGDSCILAVSTSVIGQAKWTRTKSSRRLAEFSAIDQASRGAKGSVGLLATGGAGFNATLGASIVLLMLLAGFFVQQTIKIAPDYPWTDEAWLALAVSDDGNKEWTADWMGDGTIDGLEPAIANAAISAAYGPLDTTFKASVNCHTGNCTWETSHTLAVCSACANITSFISWTYGDYDVKINGSDWGVPIIYSLPNGHRLVDVVPDPADPESYVAPILNLTHLSGFLKLPNTTAILSLAVIGTASYGITSNSQLTKLSKDPLAYECAIRWCVQELESKVINGTLYENVTKTFMDDTAPSSIVVNGTSFNASESLATALGKWLGEFFQNGNATILPTEYYANRVTSKTPPLDMIARAMIKDDLAFPKIMNNTAASMTMALRVLPGQAKFRNDRGKEYSVAVLVQVRWVWLAFPLSLLVLSGALLVLAMHDTVSSKSYPWKDSLLAAMYHSFNSEQENLGTKQSLASIDRSAKEYDVHLERTQDGTTHLRLRSLARRA